MEKNVIEFKFLLDNLIDFPSNIHENWLAKRNLPSVIRSLSRILTTTASDNLLEYLGVTKNWAKQHREIETKARDLFFVHEIPPLLQKLIFLSICRESQQMYPPKNLKSYNPITYNGLTMVKTRYSVEAFQTIFNTFVLPLISAHDQLLLYRSFLYAHTRKVPKTENKLGIIHLPINLTLQCLKSGPIGLISPGLRKKVSSWIHDLCAHCINHLNLGRAFPHTLGDPRILSLLGQSAAFFHCCSMDTLGPFKPRHSEKSLRPQINDIVLYMDSKEKSRFGKIVKIKSDTLVNLYCLQFNKLVSQDFHIRLLKLLHRPSEWNKKTGVPLSINGHPGS